MLDAGLCGQFPCARRFDSCQSSIPVQSTTWFADTSPGQPVIKRDSWREGLGGFLKRNAKRKPAPSIPDLDAPRINANVELTPPTRDPKEVQAHQEDVVDFERYLRWADKAMETDRPGTGVKIDGVLANPDRGADMNQDKLRIAKYDPLIFECLSCDQQFNASGKSVEQVADEVSAHLAQKHPELAYSDLHLKKAA